MLIGIYISLLIHSDPGMIAAIKEAVTIPVMAKARIGHFVEAQVLEALDVDYIDESEVRCYTHAHKIFLALQNLDSAPKFISKLVGCVVSIFLSCTSASRSIFVSCLRRVEAAPSTLFVCDFVVLMLSTYDRQVLTPADDMHHINKHNFKVPFVCGCRDLGEALRRIAEGAAMIRTKVMPRLSTALPASSC